MTWFVNTKHSTNFWDNMSLEMPWLLRFYYTTALCLFFLETEGMTEQQLSCSGFFLFFSPFSAKLIIHKNEALPSMETGRDFAKREHFRTQYLPSAFSTVEIGGFKHILLKSSSPFSRVPSCPFSTAVVTECCRKDEDWGERKGTEN